MDFGSRRTTRIPMKKKAALRGVSGFAKKPKSHYNKGPKANQTSKGLKKAGRRWKGIGSKKTGVKLSIGRKSSAIAKRGNNNPYSGYYAGGPTF